MVYMYVRENPDWDDVYFIGFVPNYQIYLQMMKKHEQLEYNVGSTKFLYHFKSTETEIEDKIDMVLSEYQIRRNPNFYKKEAISYLDSLSNAILIFSNIDICPLYGFLLERLDNCYKQLTENPLYVYKTDDEYREWNKR